MSVFFFFCLLFLLLYMGKYSSFFFCVYIFVFDSRKLFHILYQSFLKQVLTLQPIITVLHKTGSDFYKIPILNKKQLFAHANY